MGTDLEKELRDEQAKSGVVPYYCGEASNHQRLLLAATSGAHFSIGCCSAEAQVAGGSSEPKPHVGMAKKADGLLEGH